MLLKNKTAIIYGAAGSLGTAIAHAFANNGAYVILTGHRLAPVQILAKEINAAGGKAEAAAIDALNEKSVYDYLTQLADKGIQIEISVNAIGLRDVQGISLIDMPLNDFIRPINIAMQTLFITATAAGRIMKEQHSGGVILSLTATPGGIGYANVGGFGPACTAIEGFTRNLASELGSHKIRVINIRSAGSPDSRVFKEDVKPDTEEGQDFLNKLKDDTMLKELPMVADIANAAVFLASSMAKMITGITLDVTAGSTAALNYKVTPVSFVYK